MQPPFQPTPEPVRRPLSVLEALRFTTSSHSGWINILLCALLYLSTQIIPLIGLIVMQGFFAEIQGFVHGMAGGDDTFAAGVGVAALLSMPLWLFFIVLLNAATTRAELTGDLSKAFNLKAIWAYAGKTWKPALITSFLLAFVGLVLLMLGLMACIIGMFVSVSILYIAGLHVRWQIYNQYLLDGGKPIELGYWEPLPTDARSAQAYAATFAR